MTVAFAPDPMSVAGTWASVAGMAAVAGFIALLADSLWRQHRGWSASYSCALATTALWLIVELAAGWHSPWSGVAESLRNLAWLWFMASIVGRRSAGSGLSAVGWIYIGLFVVNLLTGIISGLAVGTGQNFESVLPALPPARMLFVAGALVLLHNLYDSARGEERRLVSLPIAAIAAMWAYDLNLYAISYLTREPAALMALVRPAAAFALVVILAVTVLRPGQQAVRLSRPVTFRSLALAAVAAWLLLLAAAASVSGMLGSEFSWRAQVALLLFGIAITVVMLVSPRTRASVRVSIAKHFFEHRYDYRAEWLRFTATLTRPGQHALPLEARIVSAIGDIVEASGGALLAEDDEGRLTLAAGLPGALAHLPVDADASDLALLLEKRDHIVQFAELRAAAESGQGLANMPQWLFAEPSLWAAVPLVHDDVVRGIVLLCRPLVDRALDWEDFDLLRVAGRQAASYLAEARGSEALLESRRFEEFHRRFAFVMHDVKNLASQLSLLARNVERHGDKPAFREDMTETVKLAAERLQSLTARLAEQDRVRNPQVAPVDLTALARRVVAAKSVGHPVTLLGDAPVWARGDADLVERLLNHLVQNAIDASEGTGPVDVMTRLAGQEAHMTIADRGTGMSAEFIRTSLFRPFVSTKDGGFGIGAFQARQFAEAMGGRLTVTSAEGEGTTFMLTLPRAEPAEIEEAA